MTESEIQQAFFRAVRLRGNYDKRWKWIHAVPNGGKRSIKTAVILKAEGVASGVWDVFVPVPVGDFAGLYIEFKRPKTDRSVKGKLTENQIEFYRDNKEYFAFVICYSAVNAYEIIEQYFNGNFVQEKIKV